MLSHSIYISNTQSFLIFCDGQQQLIAVEDKFGEMETTRIAHTDNIFCKLFERI